jgi:hypothetical protein
MGTTTTGPVYQGGLTGYLPGEETPMRTHLIRNRLLTAIGTGGVTAAMACGGAGGTSSSMDDGSTTDRGGIDARSEASSIAADSAGDGTAAFDVAASGDDSPIVADSAGNGMAAFDATGSGDDGSSAADRLDALAAADARDGADSGLPCVRRPFVVAGALRAAKATARDDWGRPLADLPVSLDARTADALYRVWRDDGLQEHASIAALARFTMLLLSVGAPPELVFSSQRASLDEIAHARACFGLARRYGGRDVGPAGLRVADAMGSTSLEQLAAMTVEEGCVGETLGVLLATEQLTCVRDPEAARVLKKLVADETRHAELAWRCAAWAIRQGGPTVRRAVQGAAQRAIAEARQGTFQSFEVDAEAWHAHGRLSSADARTATHVGIAEVIEPCLAALSEERGPRHALASRLA